MLNIYLTNLSAYNQGNLVGKWITLPLSPFELSQALSEVLCEGEAICGGFDEHEEYFITDYEWEDVEFFEIDEYKNISTLNSNMELLSELNTSMQKATAFILNEGITLDIEDAINKAEDVTIHHNQTMEDVAYELLEECYKVYSLAPIIANNIDYERVATELENNGTYWEIGGDVYEYIG